METELKTMTLKTIKTVYTNKPEISIDEEFVLPEFMPDIEKVLCFSPEIYVHSKSINGTVLGLEICYEVSLLYLNSNSDIYGQNFCTVKSQNIDTDTEFQFADVKAIPSYLNLRASSPRKIEIHGAFILDIKCFKESMPEIVTDIDSSEISVRKISVPYSRLSAIGEKQTIIDDGIILPESKPAMRGILKYECKPEITESKLISNKAIIKGDIKIKILYMAVEQTRPQIHETSIPFSQIVEIPNVEEESQLMPKVSIQSIELKEKTGYNGEIREAMFSAKLEIIVFAYSTDNVETVVDAFSKKYNIAISKEKLYSKEEIKSGNEEYVLRKSFDFADGDLASVVYISAKTNTTGCRCENNGMIVNGNVAIDIFGYDNDGNAVCIKKNADYEYKYELDNDSNYICYAKADINDISSYLNGSVLEVSLEFKIHFHIFSMNEIDAANKTEIAEKEKSQNSSSSIVIYFAADGEDIWDIAKKYNASPDDIIAENNMTSEMISGNSKIIIP